MATVSAMTEL
jgi:hypothetical protein